jgi:DNA-binding NtrC family response regulator
VGSLSSDSQSRLLKLLSEQDEQNDGYIRLLSSSSDPLEMMSSKGNFNAELFKRISMFKLSIPPFRERPEDVVGIATRMAQAGNPEAGIQLERDVELVLSHYAWPANGKELNEVMNGVLTKKDRPITVPMLPQRIVQMVGLENLRAMHQQSLAEYKGQALKNFLRDKEKQYLNNVLSSVGDNKEEAAKILDLQPDVLARHVSGDNA